MIQFQGSGSVHAGSTRMFKLVDETVDLGFMSLHNTSGRTSKSTNQVSFLDDLRRLLFVLQNKIKSFKQSSFSSKDLLTHISSLQLNMPVSKAPQDSRRQVSRPGDVVL